VKLWPGIAWAAAAGFGAGALIKIQYDYCGAAKNP
jgi:hypothetical protein